MANRERGEVMLEVGGQTYVLALTTNAMCELEDQLSTPEQTVTFLDVLQQVSRRSVRAVRALTWAALREHHPTMNVKDAGNLIQAAGGLIAFMPTAELIIQTAQPDREDVEAAATVNGRPLKARTARGTGAISTSSPAASA